MSSVLSKIDIYLAILELNPDVYGKRVIFLMYFDIVFYIVIRHRLYKN